MSYQQHLPLGLSDGKARMKFMPQKVEGHRVLFLYVMILLTGWDKSQVKSDFLEG
jgi:hypothetical protein